MKKGLKQMLMKHVHWLQQNTFGTSSWLSMSSQSNKDLTGLWGQGHASYLKRRKASFASLIKRECHGGIAKRGRGRVILFRDKERARESPALAILSGVEL